MSGADITARVGGDASGLQKALGGAKRSLQGFARDVGQKLKGAAVAGMAGAAAGMVATLKNGFDQKIMLENTETLMKSLLGGAEKAKDAMAMLGAEAKENPMFSAEEMGKAGAALAAFADKDVGKLKKLIEATEVLKTLKPSANLTDAAEALRDALGGETERLKEFGFTGKELSALKEGGITVDKIMKAMGKKGVGLHTLEEMSKGMGAQMAKMRNMWNDISLTIVEGFWPRIQATGEQFLTWITANKEQIIGILTTATEVAIKLFQWSVGAFTWIKNVVEQIAAFAGAAWATLSMNFTLANFMGWLGHLADAGLHFIQSKMADILAWLVGKIQEFAPRLFKLFGGEKTLEKLNDYSVSESKRSNSHLNKYFDGTGLNAGADALVAKQQEQQAAAAAPAPVFNANINVQQQNNMPRMMWST